MSGCERVTRQIALDLLIQAMLRHSHMARISTDPKDPTFKLSAFGREALAAVLALAKSHGIVPETTKPEDVRMTLGTGRKGAWAIRLYQKVED